MGEATDLDGATYQVRALERGLRILMSFTARQPEWSLQDLHTALAINKATLLRLLSVLRAAGFVQLDETTGRYRLGIRAFEVGSAYVAAVPLEQLALPYLRTLSARTNQTANLAVLDGQEVVHIAVAEPDRPLRFHTRVGLRDAAYCTGLGKVLLAHLDPVVLEHYLAQVKLGRRTPATITTKAGLRRELATIRAGACAEDREEDIPGLRCLAAPVRNATGQVVAAVSITGPAAEFAGPERDALEVALLTATDEISQRLGFVAMPAGNAVRRRGQA
jgi:DNA-binding IclR family transcriptional regulator